MKIGMQCGSFTVVSARRSSRHRVAPAQALADRLQVHDLGELRPAVLVDGGPVRILVERVEEDLSLGGCFPPGWC